MKTYHLILAATAMCLVSGCVTFKPSMLRVENDPIPEKLHKLAVITPSTQVGNVRTIKSQNYDFTLFQRELETNLMDRTPGNIRHQGRHIYRIPDLVRTGYSDNFCLRQWLTAMALHFIHV